MKNSTFNIQSPPEQRGENKINIEQLMEELPKAYNRFIFYQTEDGDPRLLYDELGAELFACFVARLSHPEFQKVYEFSRFVLEGVGLANKLTRKSFEKINRICKFIMD